MSAVTSPLHAASSEPAASVFVGHSGASVTLRAYEGRNVVRKTAGHSSGNERLRRQAEKQELFDASAFAVPKVLRSGFDGDLFFFEMSYINATSIAALCGNGRTASMNGLALFVAHWIARMRDETTGTIGPDRIRAKLRSVIVACRRNPVLAHAMPVIELVGGVLGQMDWPLLPEGQCHGDLTLENILVDSDGRLWLIDFDAPDLASFWLDLAKLYQDLIGHWCLRHVARQHHGPAHLNAIMAIRRLRDAIDGVVDEAMPGVRSLLPPLVALNLMRALPYCETISTAAYILDRAQAVLTP